MDKPGNDASVFAHIEALVAEEHRLFDHGSLNDGRDPSEASERDASTVKKYIG